MWESQELSLHRAACAGSGQLSCDSPPSSVSESSTLPRARNAQRAPWLEGRAEPWAAQSRGPRLSPPRPARREQRGQTLPHQPSAFEVGKTGGRLLQGKKCLLLSSWGPATSCTDPRLAQEAHRAAGSVRTTVPVGRAASRPQSPSGGSGAAPFPGGALGWSLVWPGRVRADGSHSALRGGAGSATGLGRLRPRAGSQPRFGGPGSGRPRIFS